MADAAVSDMVKLIRSIVEQETRKFDKIEVCKIASVNADGTCDIYVAPDFRTRVAGIPNGSPIAFEVGDTAYWCRVGNSAATSFLVGATTATCRKLR